MDHDHNHNSSPVDNVANSNDNHDNLNDNNDHPVFQTETFIFDGEAGPTFFSTMRNLVNQIMVRQPPPQDQDVEMSDAEHASSDEPATTDPNITSASAHIPDPTPATDEQNSAPVPPTDNSNPTDTPPRPIRPLPRPHAHFHAHTPVGIIDLYTFNITGPPPPPPPGTATFTFNIGPDILAGFEAFFLNGMQKDREPDTDRAKVLLRGMEIVPSGLVRRLEKAGGVPGGQGNEDGASGCAVCWGPLVEEVEPGEWDAANRRDEKGKSKEKEDSDKDVVDNDEEDEFRGRIVALPCAHVYHAECLLPWFSRNTTCPTCRFDVDPESLTWNPQPPPGPPPEMDGEGGQDVPFPFPFPFPFSAGENIILTPDATNDTNANVNPPPNPDSSFSSDQNTASNPNPDPDPTADINPNMNPTDARDSPNPTVDEIRRANATEAARFNSFMTAIMRSMAVPQPRHEQQGQGGEQQQQSQDDQQSAQSQPQLQSHSQPPPQNQPQPQIFMPRAPLPTPTQHNLRGLFRMSQFPLFVAPQAPGQGQGQGDISLPPVPSESGFASASGSMPTATTTEVTTATRPQVAIPFPSSSSSVEMNPSERVNQQQRLAHFSGHSNTQPPFLQHGYPSNLPQTQSQSLPQPQNDAVPQPQPQPQQAHAFQVLPRFLQQRPQGFGFRLPPPPEHLQRLYPGIIPHPRYLHYPHTHPHPQPQHLHNPHVHPDPHPDSQHIHNPQFQAHPYPSEPRPRTNSRPGPPPALHPQSQAHRQPHFHPHPRYQARQHERRKPWTPPEPVGKTLRQRVEAKERELGLRCDDVVCGVGPEDDDDRDDGVVGGNGGEVRMIKIHAAYDASGRACEHKFHAGCLVTSARVAGEGEECGCNEGGVRGRRTDIEAGTEAAVIAEEQTILISCPVCRAEGSLTKGEWDEGVKMSMAVA